MVDKKLADSCKNITWELNHGIIRNTYVDLIKEFKRKPTYKEISEKCNLSINTIKKHIDTLRFNPLKHPLRIFSDDVLMAIIYSAKNGSTSSQKLYMQLCEGWSEKQIIEHEGELNLTDVRKKLIEKLKSGTKGGNKREV